MTWETSLGTSYYKTFLTSKYLDIQPWKNKKNWQHSLTSMDSNHLSVATNVWSAELEPLQESSSSKNMSDMGSEEQFLKKTSTHTRWRDTVTTSDENESNM